MAEENSGAAPGDQIDWEAIDWPAVEKEVRRLQSRIVKAQEAGRYNRVKVLQGLLTRSRAAKLLAIKRVTENDGSKTPGVDQVTWTSRRSKEMVLPQLSSRGYKPLPLRRIYIPKSNGKLRPLGIPVMRDRAMQALHLLALDPIAETTADPNSYGFRIGRSCADAIQQCFMLLSGGRDRWILEGDIKGCFDHISHEWLLEHIPMDRTILRKWLKCGYLDKNVFSETDEGTPQGGIISPVLANMALDGLETLLNKTFPAIVPHGKPRVRFVRYADDFVIIARSKQLLENEVLPLLIDFLRERGLELSLEKTMITHLKDGFNFLGQNIRAFGAKTIIRPSKKNIAAFLDKVRTVIKSNAQVTAATLVHLLNPKIQGWANYHRHVCSKKTFEDIDHQIHRCTWRWAKRRHKRDNKNQHWIGDKYYATRGKRKWCFFGDEIRKKGIKERYWLRHAASTPIVRHIKVKADAHPYKPDWQEYWQQRKQRNAKRLLEGSSEQMAFDFYARPPRPAWGVTEA
jgi:RNA-directed DNA polymerase